MCEAHSSHARGHDHGDQQHADGHGHGHGLSAPPPSDGAAECPVMPGSTISKADAEDAGLVRDYEGQRYYLCCAACGPLFDADPAKYASVR
ncbi:YHS domain-containing protein [Agrococcus beijingensis]|uniref:YHS domain-containing protein n=1 Tax=Agrococcus beijingensis TaxID=3068634 RepID=UPI002740A513|nr:YHS domain-containing protein [Agrococcus sp. REN33]